MAEYTNAQVALLAAVEYNKTSSSRSIDRVERDADHFLEWMDRRV